MTAVLNCLNNGQNGLLESPTGTGVVKTGQHGTQLALLVQNLELRVLQKIDWSALVLVFISKLTVASKDLLLDIFCQVFVCKC